MKWDTPEALVAYLRASPSSEAGRAAATLIEQLISERHGHTAHIALLKASLVQAERDVDALTTERDRLRAAVHRQVKNIERWMETGEPAGPEESQSIYEQLKAALTQQEKV